MKEFQGTPEEYEELRRQYERTLRDRNPKAALERDWKLPATKGSEAFDAAPKPQPKVPQPWEIPGQRREPLAPSINENVRRVKDRLKWQRSPDLMPDTIRNSPTMNPHYPKYSAKDPNPSTRNKPFQGGSGKGNGMSGTGGSGSNPTPRPPHPRPGVPPNASPPSPKPPVSSPPRPSTPPTTPRWFKMPGKPTLNIPNPTIPGSPLGTLGKGLGMAGAGAGAAGAAGDLGEHLYYLFNPHHQKYRPPPKPTPNDLPPHLRPPNGRKPTSFGNVGMLYDLTVGWRTEFYEDGVLTNTYTDRGTYRNLTAPFIIVTTTSSQYSRTGLTAASGFGQMGGVTLEGYQATYGRLSDDRGGGMGWIVAITKNTELIATPLVPDQPLIDMSDPGMPPNQPIAADPGGLPSTPGNPDPAPQPGTPIAPPKPASPGIPLGANPSGNPKPGTPGIPISASPGAGNPIPDKSTPPPDRPPVGDPPLQTQPSTPTIPGSPSSNPSSPGQSGTPDMRFPGVPAPAGALGRSPGGSGGATTGSASTGANPKIGQGTGVATPLDKPDNKNRTPDFTPRNRPDEARTGEGKDPPPKVDTPNPTQQCRYDSLGIGGKVDLANTSLGAISTFQQQQIMGGINQANQKLGGQLFDNIGGQMVPTGISARLIKIGRRVGLNYVLTGMAFLTTLHNAFMLSNMLTMTLFSFIDTTAMLFIDDPNGEAINSQVIVGGAVENFFKATFGVEATQNAKHAWNKFNRIYQAATNILFSMQSMIWSIYEILEILGQWNVRIIDVLEKWGVIGSEVWGALSPNLNFTQLAVWRKIMVAQEVVENLEAIAGELLNVKEVAGQLQIQTTELQNAVRGVDKDGNPIGKPDLPDHIQTRINKDATKQDQNSKPYPEIGDLTPAPETDSIA